MSKSTIKTINISGGAVQADIPDFSKDGDSLDNFLDNHENEGGSDDGGSVNISNDSSSDTSSSSSMKSGGSVVLSGGASDTDTESTADTIEKLSADPLFLVLSNFLSSGDINIVDAVLKLNTTLKKLAKRLK